MMLREQRMEQMTKVITERKSSGKDCMAEKKMKGGGGPEARNKKFSSDKKAKGLEGADSGGVAYDKFHTSEAHDTKPEGAQNEQREDVGA